VRRRQRPEVILLEVLLLAAVLAALLLLALNIVPTYARRPWDFETYWYASNAAIHGMNPYDSSVLARLSGQPVGMPFIYPPITLPFLMPLTLLPVEGAAQVWFAFKALLLVPLVMLWRRYFLPATGVVILAAVAVFGFNAACIWDLGMGNVAVIEELTLWAGFAAYVADRRRLFAACVLAASLFKLFPIVFLVLLLVPSRTFGPQWRLAGSVFALFLLLVFAPTVAGFTWARGFLGNLPMERPWGLVNPSALGFIDTLLGDHTTPLTSPPFKALALWTAYAMALAGISLPALRGLWRRRDPREWVLAGAILYALLVPRMMVYSYLLVILPVLGLIGPIASRVGGLAIPAALLCGQAALWPLLGLSYRSIWSQNIWYQNLSFLILLGAWLIYLFAATARRRPAP